MKRIDVKISDISDEALTMLQETTERNRTDLIAEAIALLVWANEVHERGHVVAEANPITKRAETMLHMPLFKRGQPKAHVPNRVPPSSTVGKQALPQGKPSIVLTPVGTRN